MGTRLLILLLLLCPGAAAAQDDLSPPRQSIPAPWGLWADRAPYPYYDGPVGIDCDDDLVARDIWFDFSGETWLTRDRLRGGSGLARARFGLFHADVAFTQLASTRERGLLGAQRVRDWSYIVDVRGHLGVSIPLPVLGYLDFGAGGAGFDETPGLGRAGFSFRAAASIYPVWPLQLEAHASRAQFLDGTGVNDFGAKAHVQVFRHLFVTAGWRWMSVDGGRFSTHGLTFGLSFQWSNLRTFFWEPMRGPAW